MPIRISDGGTAKAAGLDLTRYSDEQLRVLNGQGDGKIDATEADAAVRFADGDGDGFVSDKELRALDYTLGKETSLASAKAFTAVQEGRLDGLGRTVAEERSESQQRYQDAYKTHDGLVNDLHAAVDDSRRALDADGIPVPTESSAQLKQRMDALGDPDRLSPDDKQQLQVLNRQFDHAQMKEAFGAAAGDAYAERETRAKELRVTKVETQTVDQLLGAARARMPTARAIVDSETAVKAAAGMRMLREVTQKNPQVQRDAAKLLKARQIKEAVDAGKLDRDDVDMKKLNADLQTYGARVARHTMKLENTARGTVRYMESPEFKRAMEALPPDERARIEGDLHSMISDTKAGEAFFDRNILPALKNAPNADPYYVKMLKGGATYSKMGLGALQTWGGLIAKKGGPQAMELLNNGVAQALGVKPSQVGKVYDAIEVANTKGMDAAQRQLANDPALGKLAGGFDKIAKGVSFATGVVAAYELRQKPDLRNSLAAAGSAVEISGILASAAKGSKALSTYARFAGKVAPGIDVLVGGIDMAKSIGRGDTAGAIGGGMQATGGAMMLAAAATGVGLPLAVVGGVLSVGGAVVSAIWGDSPTEEWLKENAPEYVD